LQTIRLHVENAGGRPAGPCAAELAVPGLLPRAVHAVHRLLDQFPDGHLYADLRGYIEGQDPVHPGGVLQVFLHRLGIPAEEVPAGLEERVSSV
jgi:hypothetical protein